MYNQLTQIKDLEQNEKFTFPLSDTVYTVIDSNCGNAGCVRYYDEITGEYFRCNAGFWVLPHESVTPLLVEDETIVNTHLSK